MKPNSKNFQLITHVGKSANRSFTNFFLLFFSFQNLSIFSLDNSGLANTNSSTNYKLQIKIIPKNARRISLEVRKSSSCSMQNVIQGDLNENASESTTKRRKKRKKIVSNIKNSCSTRLLHKILRKSVR